MRFNIDDDGQMMAEDVGLDNRGNIIKINTQALEDKTSAEIYYDTTEVSLNFMLWFEITTYSFGFTWLLNKYKSYYLSGYDRVQTSWSLFSTK